MLFCKPGLSVPSALPSPGNSQLTDFVLRCSLLALVIWTRIKASFILVRMTHCLQKIPDRNLYIADSCQGRITVVPPLFMNILVILIKKVALLTGYATCMLNSLSDTINISFPCNARPRRKLLLIHLRISQTHSLRLSMLTFHHRQLSVMYLPKVLFWSSTLNI